MIHVTSSQIICIVQHDNSCDLHSVHTSTNVLKYW